MYPELAQQFHSIFSDVEGEVEAEVDGDGEIEVGEGEEIEDPMLLETVQEVSISAADEDDDLPAPKLVTDVIHDNDSDFENRSPDRGE